MIKTFFTTNLAKDLSVVTVFEVQEVCGIVSQIIKIDNVTHPFYPAVVLVLVAHCGGGYFCGQLQASLHCYRAHENE